MCGLTFVFLPHRREGAARTRVPPQGATLACRCLSNSASHELLDHGQSQRPLSRHLPILPPPFVRVVADKGLQATLAVGQVGGASSPALHLSNQATGLAMLHCVLTHKTVGWGVVCSCMSCGAEVASGRLRVGVVPRTHSRLAHNPPWHAAPPLPPPLPPVHPAVPYPKGMACRADPFLRQPAAPDSRQPAGPGSYRLPVARRDSSAKPRQYQHQQQQQLLLRGALPELPCRRPAASGAGLGAAAAAAPGRRRGGTAPRRGQRRRPGSCWIRIWGAGRAGGIHR